MAWIVKRRSVTTVRRAACIDGSRRTMIYPTILCCKCVCVGGGEDELACSYRAGFRKDQRRRSCQITGGNHYVPVAGTASG